MKKIDKEEEEMEKMKRNGSDGKKSKRYILHDTKKYIERERQKISFIQKERGKREERERERELNLR